MTPNDSEEQRRDRLLPKVISSLAEVSMVLPGATGDCGDEAGLGIGAEEKGSSGGPLNAEVI